MIDQTRTKYENSPAYYHLVALSQNTATLASALAAKTWFVTRTPPNTFFVMSDSPVSTVEVVNGKSIPGSGFGGARTAVILPLSPSHLFVASPPGVQWKPIGTETAVHAANILTVRFAGERVFAHFLSPQIQELVDDEINQIVFGENAFIPTRQVLEDSGTVSTASETG